MDIPPQSEQSTSVNEPHTVGSRSHTTFIVIASNGDYETFHYLSSKARLRNGVLLISDYETVATCEGIGLQEFFSPLQRHILPMLRPVHEAEIPGLKADKPDSLVRYDRNNTACYITSIKFENREK